MRQLSHFRAKPCDNKNCRWSKEERIIAKERLSVDKTDNSMLSAILQDGSIFMIGTFMCECSYHVRVEPIFVEENEDGL